MMLFKSNFSSSGYFYKYFHVSIEFKDCAKIFNSNLRGQMSNTIVFSYTIEIIFIFHEHSYNIYDTGWVYFKDRWRGR